MYKYIKIVYSFFEAKMVHIHINCKDVEIGLNIYKYIRKCWFWYIWAELEIQPDIINPINGTGDEHSLFIECLVLFLLLKKVAIHFDQM